MGKNKTLDERHTGIDDSHTGIDEQHFEGCLNYCSKRPPQYLFVFFSNFGLD
jgi:hypothetical protein